MTTTLALRGVSVSKLIFEQVVEFFVSMNKAIAMARSVEANWEVAQHLQHDYKGMSVPEIAAILNERSRKDIYGDD